jgi:hypothetical protein
MTGRLGELPHKLVKGFLGELSADHFGAPGHLFGRSERARSFVYCGRRRAGLRGVAFHLETWTADIPVSRACGSPLAHFPPCPTVSAAPNASPFVPSAATALGKLFDRLGLKRPAL